MALRGWFSKFRETVARQRAVLTVKRAEKNLSRRLKRWEARHPGYKAEDPRRSDAGNMNTNQLKAYARYLNRVRGQQIKAAGVMAPSGELLGAAQFEEYASLWQEREASKERAIQSMRLKNVQIPQAMALLDIDPETGQLRPSYGSNYVLQKFGDVQIPPTQEALERRIASMRKWKPIEERLDISENNMAKKLAVIDSGLADKWNSLTRGQKQYLINNEKLFDLANWFTITTDEMEVLMARLANEDRFDRMLEELYSRLNDASKLEQA